LEKLIVIQSDQEEIKVGVMEEDRLVELYLEDKKEAPLVGSIYKGKVENVLPGMQSAFVNIGLAKNAFLFVQEAISQSAGEQNAGEELPPIETLVQEGQELMVQLIKEPNGQKGARISTQITLAGRYLVYLPTSDHIGISRKIEDEADREKLKKLADQLRSPGEGLIIRTVALGRDEQELAGDLAVLKAKWQQIKKKYLKTPPGGAVYFDLTLGERLVRDFVKDNITAIVVNNNDLHEQISTLLNILSPGKLNNLKLVEEDLFFKYQLYDEIEAALQPKVWLKSGGYLVLNQTEALMVVDVNTGKFVGHKSLEDTVLRINLEAVTEACRQIRLRNVGGIIIIDLIDMKQDNHKQQVLELVGEEVKKDHMRVTILGLTNLGLVEMTRKKVRPSLANLLLVECDTCGGTGYVRKKENQGILDMNE